MATEITIKNYDKKMKELNASWSAFTDKFAWIESENSPYWDEEAIVDEIMRYDEKPVLNWLRWFAGSSLRNLLKLVGVGFFLPKPAFHDISEKRRWLAKQDFSKLNITIADLAKPDEYFLEKLESIAAKEAILDDEAKIILPAGRVSLWPASFRKIFKKVSGFISALFHFFTNSGKTKQEASKAIQAPDLVVERNVVASFRRNVNLVPAVKQITTANKIVTKTEYIEYRANCAFLLGIGYHLPAVLHAAPLSNDPATELTAADFATIEARLIDFRNRELSLPHESSKLNDRYLLEMQKGIMIIGEIIQFCQGLQSLGENQTFAPVVNMKHDFLSHCFQNGFITNQKLILQIHNIGQMLNQLSLSDDRSDIRELVSAGEYDYPRFFQKVEQNAVNNNLRSADLLRRTEVINESMSQLTINLPMLRQYGLSRIALDLYASSNELVLHITALTHCQINIPIQHTIALMSRYSSWSQQGHFALTLMEERVRTQSLLPTAKTVSGLNRQVYSTTICLKWMQHLSRKINKRHTDKQRSQDVVDQQDNSSAIVVRRARL